ncbi:hypothetical protein PybrP1_001506 [[Pythium] brassicae (nom. inval.)]|nr:hypothetical protein PybrP1_001506 [[Pythium] brassicae (nom. inval.)]
MVLARPSLLAAAAAAMLATSAAGFQLTVQNSCTHKVELYSRMGGSRSGDAKNTIAVGGSYTQQIPKGYEGHFRHGQDDAATLVEFSTVGAMPTAWFDISIIPPRLNKGFEFCGSLDECKKNSKSGKGYNVPVQITPLSNTNGNQCRQLTCLADGCTDAYLYPKDDTKTHACPLATDFEVTFCPGGAGGASAPAATPAATTKAPAKDEGAGKVVPGNYDVDDDEVGNESGAQTKAPAPKLDPKAVNPAMQQSPATTAPPKVVVPPVTTAPPTKAVAPPVTTAPPTKAAVPPVTTAPPTKGAATPSVTPTADKPKTPKPKRCLP